MMPLMTAGLIAAGVSACSRSTAGSAVRIGDAGCQHVSAPLTPITPRDDVEPLLWVPLPDGWKIQDHRLRDIRLSMWSDKPTHDGHRAHAWLIMDSGITVAETPEAELESQGRAIMIDGGGASNMRPTALQVCGHPAMLFRYHQAAWANAREHDAEVLAVAAESAGTVYVARLALSADNCDDPQYRRDADTILRGFEMVLRGAVNG